MAVDKPEALVEARSWGRDGWKQGTYGDYLVARLTAGADKRVKGRSCIYDYDFSE